MDMGLLNTVAETSMVSSKDTTPIAFEKTGKGPNLILIDGALSFRKSKGVKELVDKLAEDFTVISYDRRGRGESRDNRSYRVEKEIEDIEALIDDAGGIAFLFGVSSGAVLALKAAEKLGEKKVSKLAIYEPPFGAGEMMGEKEYEAHTKEIKKLVDADKPSEAVVAFFKSLQVPAEQIEAMKKSADWKNMESVGHTLVYDYEILGGGNIPVDLIKNLESPTLVLDGEKSFEFMHKTADDLAKTIPNATRKTLKGQTHEIVPEVIAPVLREFFS